LETFGGGEFIITLFAISILKFLDSVDHALSSIHVRLRLNCIVGYVHRCRRIVGDIGSRCISNILNRFCFIFDWNCIIWLDHCGVIRLIFNWFSDIRGWLRFGCIGLIFDGGLVCGDCLILIHCLISSCIIFHCLILHSLICSCLVLIRDDGIILNSLIGSSLVLVRDNRIVLIWDDRIILVRNDCTILIRDDRIVLDSLIGSSLVLVRDDSTILHSLIGNSLVLVRDNRIILIRDDRIVLIRNDSIVLVWDDRIVLVWDDRIVLDRDIGRLILVGRLCHILRFVFRRYCLIF